VGDAAALRRRLSWTLAALLVACTPARPSSRPASAADATARSGPRSGGDTEVENEVFDLVNAHRVARGLRALALDGRAAYEARRHSAAMAAGRAPLGHEGFRDRVAAIGRVTPCQRSAENVAFDRGHANRASEAVRGWLRSREHRTNVEGPYDVTGVGVASNAAGDLYVTQIFLGGCGPSPGSR
jgi:uncharacterized protein YkwD